MNSDCYSSRPQSSRFTSVELNYHYPNNGHVSVNIWICNTSTFNTLVKASRLSLITTFLRLSINNLDEQDTISGRTEYLLWPCHCQLWIFTTSTFSMNAPVHGITNWHTQFMFLLLIIQISCLCATLYSNNGIGKPSMPNRALNLDYSSSQSQSCRCPRDTETHPFAVA